MQVGKSDQGYWKIYDIGFRVKSYLRCLKHTE